MICVPGGGPVAAVMRVEEVLGWLRTQAAGAQLVTSVCTGSLILAAAGLLDGYRTGCHWAWGEYLALFGAIYVAERTVVDRNRSTAGGVTSGIDFAFRVVELLLVAMSPKPSSWRSNTTRSHSAAARQQPRGPRCWPRSAR